MLPQPEAMTPLINAIISKYFKKVFCLYFMGLDIRFEVNNLKFVTFSLHAENPFFTPSCDTFIIQTRNPLKTLESIEDKIKSVNVTSFNERSYIFLPEVDVYYEDDLFEYNRFYDVIDLLLVNSSEDSGRLSLWTHKYAGRNEYVPELLDEWSVHNSSFVNGNDLFPNKIKDGRIFNLGAFNYEPYVNLDTMHGIEIQMITEYVHRYNMTLNISKSSNKWGDLFMKNKSGTGILGLLLKNELDVTIGAFYFLGPKMVLFDYVLPTVRIGNTCLVPSPRIITGFFTPVVTFTYGVWIIIFVIIVTYITILLYLGKRVKSDVLMEHSAFKVISIFLQQTVSAVTQSKYAYFRRIMGGIILFSWIISVYYSSKMYSIMANPWYSDAIRTVEDLDRSGYSWGASDDSYVEGMRYSHKYNNLLSKLKIRDDQTLLRLLYDGDFGILIEHLNHGYVLRSNVTASDMKYYSVMKEDLYWTYGTMLLKKNSVLRSSLQTHLMLAREGGLHMIWEQLAFLEANYDVQMEMKISIYKKETDNLTIHHVKGVLALWVIGNTIAFISFMAENIYSSLCLKTKKKIHSK